MSTTKQITRDPDLLVPWIKNINGLWRMVEVNKLTMSYQGQEVHWKNNDLFEDMFRYTKIVGFNNRSHGVVFTSCSTGANYFVHNDNFDKIMRTYSLVMGTLSGYWYFIRRGSAWYLCYQGPN